MPHLVLTSRQHAAGDAARPHARDIRHDPHHPADRCRLHVVTLRLRHGAVRKHRGPVAAFVERIRVDTHARVTRVIRPGQAVTMEFSGERVNVNVNEREAIVGVTCG